MKRLLSVACCVLLALGIGSLAFASGVLRMTEAWPTYIDPAIGSDLSSSLAFVNLYDSLVYPDFTGTPQPHLASSWEVSDDALTWTFHLRDDVVFHDGTPLTADDVVFSLERLKLIGQGYAYLFASVAGAVAIDDHTVQFSFEQPSGVFLASLFRLYVVNKDLVLANLESNGPYGEMGDYGTGYLLLHDAGSGPYRVKDFRLEEELIMERNAGYWIPFDSDCPDEFHLIGTTEPTTVRTMISRGELEIADFRQPQENIAAMEHLDGIDVAEYFTGYSLYGMIHTQKAPTDDVHFRRAMAYAVDYATMIDMIFPGSRTLTSPVPSSVPGSAVVADYSQNMDLARQELALSKYADCLGEYPVEIHWCAEVPDEEKVALLFMANMAELGITVNVVKVPWMSMIDEMASIETSPNVITVYTEPHYAEAGSVLESRYHSNSAATWEQNEWLLDPALDEAIETALATVDRSDRFSQYEEIQTYLADLCPSLCFFEQVKRQAYQASYVNWPAANGDVVPVMGYNFAARFIQVFDH